MPLDGFARDLLQPHALDLAVGAGEIFGDEIGSEAHRIEDLRAAIGLIGGDAHLRHDLEQALVGRLDVALDRFLRRKLLVELGQHRLDGLEGEIGIDRFRAVTGKRRELMHLIGLAGLDHQADRGPQAAADQMMMHRTGRQQRGDGHAVGAGGAVGQDDDVLARAHSLLGALAELVERLAHGGGAVVGAKGDVERDGAELVVGDLADAPDALQIVVGQDRMRRLEPLLLRGAFEVEQVRPRPDEGHERHDELLADRVDRRVGHLGEVLLEIRVQQLGLVGQRRDRRVGAHRADRFLAGLGHGQHQELGALLRVAERLLAIEQADIGARRRRGAPRQLMHADLGAVQPLLIGMRRGELGLDLLVGDDAALLKVDEQHLAGLQPPFLDDGFLGDRQHAALGGHDDQAIVGDEVARGPQAVAVERGADLAAVGEGHGGGAVPRLHQAGVILVKRAALGIHQRIAGPRLGDQHHRRMREAVAALHEEFERVVEAGGVGLAFVGNRPELFDVGTEQRRGYARLARGHPVEIAAQCIDLAVMGDHAVGVGELPGREGVGRKALMHERERRGEQRMMQIGVIRPELIGEEHALVDQRAAGQRYGIETDVAAAGIAVDGVGDHLAQHVEPALEIVLILDVGPATDKHLAVRRLGLDHRCREAGIVRRHVAPAEQLQPLRLDDALDHGLAIDALRAIARHEHVADGVMAGLGQLDPERSRDLLQECVRDLHQDTGAVTGQRVGARRPAMGEVLQDLDAMLDDLVARPPLEVGYEADATGVVLALRIIESLRERRRRPRRGYGTRERPTRCHRHMKPRPRLTPRARGGQKSLGQRPDLHQLRARSG